MLKIKDSVDLKELEKYGFISCDHNKYKYKFEFSRYVDYQRDDKNYRKKLKSVMGEGIIVRDNRELVLNYDLKNNYPSDLKGFGGVVENLDVLYDLIQAGLIEKIEE